MPDLTTPAGGEAAVPSRRSTRKATRNPERTRQKLLKAATVEFAARGLEGARVDQIADRAGTNKQLLYHYFGSKEQLYVAVLEDAYRRFRARERVLSAEPLPPREAIATLTNVIFDSFLALPDVVALIADENIHKGRHVSESGEIKEMHGTMVAQVAHILATGEVAGVFRPGVDPTLLIFSIIGLCNICISNRYTLSAIYGRDLSTSGETAAYRAHVVDLVLNGIRI